MSEILQFSVLGVGTSFVDSEQASMRGFSNCDMDTDLLPPRLRRRMSVAIRLALTAGERACKAADVSLDSMPTVFASIAGEINVTDKLCRNIAEKNLPVSPTQFHNSVHNTAAGYWSIATKNQHASQAIGAGENTLVMGLLECYCQLQTGADQVLLICYEEKAPEPLVVAEQISDCAVALLLGRADNGGPSLGIFKDNLQEPQQSWSAVAKALDLVELVEGRGSQNSVAVSKSMDRWRAQIMSV